MSFINFPSPTPLFPVLSPLSWVRHKKPGLASTAHIAASGRTHRLGRAVYPRWSFDLTYGGDSWLREQTQNITPDARRFGQTELEQISGLFVYVLGSYGEFYYDDPDDDSRLAQAVGVGNGSQTIFQLFYSWGSGPFMPSFVAPVSGINTIDAVYINGGLQSPSIYAPDATNTKIQFTSAPSAGVVITADFHFYFRCHFLADVSEYEQWALNLWENKQVQFESVKP